jgi:hypothetical protein
VNLTHVTVTPEAAIMTRRVGSSIAGRIDDRYVSPGSSVQQPTRRDLEDALMPRSPKAECDGKRTSVGCFIADFAP